MPETKYRRLREEDRHVIYRMSKAGKSQEEIAEAIGFSQSAVSRELSRNRGLRGYRPAQAERLSQERRACKSSRPRSIRGEVQEQVIKRLRLKHSPEQICGAMRLEGYGPSHETIYRYIMDDKKRGGRLYLNLRINGKRRYRHRSKASREKIPNRVGIEKRPASVRSRARYGDWEADLIAGSGGSGYLLSLYERKSRMGKIARLQSKGSEEVCGEIVALLQGLKARTITYDNGLEFARHEQVSRELGSKGFFCQPYHSWEKGGVENFNGLVRQYIPKGSDLGAWTAKMLQSVEDEINQRPRKVHGFRPPSAFAAHIAA